MDQKSTQDRDVRLASIESLGMHPQSGFTTPANIDSAATLITADIAQVLMPVGCEMVMII